MDKKPKIINLLNESNPNLKDSYRQVKTIQPKKYKKENLTNYNTDKNNIQKRTKKPRYPIEPRNSPENIFYEIEENIILNKSIPLQQIERDDNISYIKKRTKKPLKRISNNKYNSIRDSNKLKTIPHPQIHNNRYYDKENEYYDNELNYKDNQNDYENSSMEDDYKIIIKNSRSPEARISHKIGNILSNYYEEEENKLRQKEQSYRNRNYSSSRNRQNRMQDNNINTDEEIDDLIQIIEDLQNNLNEEKNKVRKLKIDNIKKGKKIYNMNNELNELQKELEEKNKELEESLYNNEQINNQKLKKEYPKISRESENINEVTQKIEEKYDDTKNDTVNVRDEHVNEITDNNNDLENNSLEIKTENEKPKIDYEEVEKLKFIKKMPEYKSEEEFNKLNDDYDKLNEDYNKLNEDYQKIKDDYNDINNEYEKLKNENIKLKEEKEGN